MDIRTEADLAGVAVALGADKVAGWTEAEKALAEASPKLPVDRARRIREQILDGLDPLGEAFCTIRTPARRRPLGATYTPDAIVTAMAEWASRRRPVRVVDPGAGSGRFTVAAGRRFKKAQLVAVEVDPLARLVLRANLATCGFAGRAVVEASDYRLMQLPPCTGTTLFWGNPPYVRHHQIGAGWKRWLTETARSLGLDASQLAGLHVHFLVATARQAKAGDYGAFITSAEWLDVNYGALVRKLFLGLLGGESIHIIEPIARPFVDAEVTAAIACFRFGKKPASIRLRRVADLQALRPLAAGLRVSRKQLEAARRWSPLSRRRARKTPAGYVELGELCRVHRGQVTGANKVWIADGHSGELPPSVLFPTVTRARELFAAGTELADAAWLRRVIDLPADLDRLPGDERTAVERFLQYARGMGADRGFVASHRKAWWAVGLREPAPILATYMARRPPAFVRNLAGARHLNVAHGLYPREPMPGPVLNALARWLAQSTSMAEGRTYAGGLTKFEPKEMERLLVPSPSLLAEGAF